MELNKIAAAILLAGLIGMLAGKTSELLYHGGGHHGDEKRGYSIEVTETAATGVPKKEEKLADIGAFIHEADVAAGEAYFKKRCASCHNWEQGGGNKIGPAMWGVLNRGIGSVSGFKYSNALANKGGDWDYEALNGFLHKPKKWAPGTIMAYAGIKKDEDRADVILFLRSLGKDSVALPPKISLEEISESEQATAE